MAVEQNVAFKQRWYSLGLANFVVVIVLALAFWWLLGDPKWSPFHWYPLPFNATLFWAILFIVFVGFNCEFFGFDRIPQPVRGLVLIAATVAFSVLMTWALASGIGHLFPDFAAHRAGGLGYFTGALFVLFGFFVYVMVVINHAHWPWTALGMRQPLTGLCEIAFAFVPTFILYLVFGLPSLSLSTPSGHALMSVNLCIGFWYSVVVATLLTGLAGENWPWSAARTGGRTALAATIGNIALGVVIYFVLLGICRAIIGSSTVKAMGDVIHEFPAELGVCWNFWIIFWANAFGNWPNDRSRAVNIAARAVITFALGLVTFVFYYYWMSGHVLHEPVVAGSLHGNALGFLDWCVLWTLFYVICLESYGLPKPIELLPAAPAEGHLVPEETEEVADGRSVRERR
jgi:amino acid transporter, AAT family